MFTYAMEFFQKFASLKKPIPKHFFTSLKKPIPKHFFTSLLQDLSIEDLVSLGNLLSTKFMKPSR
jgi:hypothetical protein